MRDLSPQEIAALVASLMALVVWFGALRNQNGWNREMKRRREDKARRDSGDDSPPTPPRTPTGPWG